MPDFPASYPKPPIVEASVEVRFDARAWTPVTAEIIKRSLAHEYTAPERHAQAIQVTVNPGSVTTEQTAGAVFLPSPDGLALVGLGVGVLSVHVLAPYPGWARFKPRVERAIELVRDSTDAAVVLVGTRYIDRIGLPPDKPINAFFPFLPNRPEAMPDTLEGFHLVTQASSEADRFFAVMRLASVAGAAAQAPLEVLYDLNVFRTFDPPLAADLPAILEHVEFLHKRQRLIFEQSITDETRSLFK